MSVGHPHKRPNKLAHTRELGKLLQTGGAPALMKRWNKFDLDSDIPYLCGYNVGGTTRFADCDYVRCLHDPAYAEQIIGGPIDTGLNPLDTLECCFWHEEVEKTILDADNPINDYEEAHEFATAAEHERVRAKGGTPVRYERGLERIIKYCERKPLKRVPHDYACAPYLDEPDANDHRIIKELQALGVTDAFKISKASVNYGKSTGPTHCSICAMWQGGGNAALSECRLVDGLVRDTDGCDRFEPQENNDGETHSSSAQQNPHG
jgi:hypothetical protein